MANYDYQCKKCRHEFEISASFADKDKGLHPKCPKCGAAETGQIFKRLNVVDSMKSKEPERSEMPPDMGMPGMPYMPPGCGSCGGEYCDTC